jgi:hypothetical protein
MTLYARIRRRGQWGKSHIAPAGITTLCGLMLGNVRAVVELSNCADGETCNECRRLAQGRRHN